MKLGAGEKPESMLTFKNILIVVLIALFVFSFGVILVTNDSIRESMYFDNQTDK
jgi:hypothetical protein